VCEHEELGVFWSRVLYADAQYPVNGPPHLFVESYALVGSSHEPIPKLDRSRLVGLPAFIDHELFEDEVALVVGNKPFRKGEVTERAIFQLGIEYHDQYCKAYDEGFVPKGPVFEPDVTSIEGFLRMLERTARERADTLTRID